MTNERLRQLWGTAVDTCHLRIATPDPLATCQRAPRQPNGSPAEIAAQVARRARERALKPFDKGDDHKEIARLTGNDCHQ